MKDVHDQQIKPLNIDELLGREPITLDNSEISNMIENKNVLVTGAGGSIGSELVRQLICHHPKKLILFDIYEHGVYKLQQELIMEQRDDKYKDVEIIVRIGSVYNLKRIETIFKLYNPNFVYHAAAYKHVPLMEDSPVEAIRTNVVGTYNVASLALKYKITKMILVSTDKAVRPTNVMGATKRFAETIIQYFDSKSNGTSYSAVRFGNVLGSNGSVVPLFTEQIQRGGPVTVTHPKINRFFMTIPEAVSLILQSSLFAKGGEIFILDMGKPMSIVALAEKMIRQAGYTPYKDMKIVFTGLRPGEKLYEEILLDPKTQIKTDNSKIFIEEEKVIFPIEEEMKEISSVFDMESNLDIVEELKKIITTYKDPNEVNKGIE
jgi:FlaA1/EpsC-like NDP-sugar epimerase